MRKEDDESVYMPTEEEIAKACKNLQQSWSEEDFFKRANIKKKDYVVPVCDVETPCVEFIAESSIYRR